MGLLRCVAAGEAKGIDCACAIYNKFGAAEGEPMGEVPLNPQEKAEGAGVRRELPSPGPSLTGVETEAEPRENAGRKSHEQPANKGGLHGREQGHEQGG